MLAKVRCSSGTRVAPARIVHATARVAPAVIGPCCRAARSAGQNAAMRHVRSAPAIDRSKNRRGFRPVCTVPRVPYEHPPSAGFRGERTRSGGIPSCPVRPTHPPSAGERPDPVHRIAGRGENRDGGTVGTALSAWTLGYVCAHGKSSARHERARMPHLAVGAVFAFDPDIEAPMRHAPFRLPDGSLAGGRAAGEPGKCLRWQAITHSTTTAMPICATRE